MTSSSTARLLGVPIVLQNRIFGLLAALIELTVAQVMEDPQ